MPEPPADAFSEEDDLEYKPWVKYSVWTALGAGCLVLGYYAFYSWGFACGRREAVEMAQRSIAGVLQVAGSKDMPSAEAAAERVDTSRAESESSRNEREKIESSLAGILGVASSTDEALLRMAADAEQVFGGIVNAAQRHEAQGMLLSALMDRGLLMSAEELLDKTMPPALPQSAVWAQRMLRAAHTLATHGKWEKARAYLQALLAEGSPLETDVVLRAWADMALEARLDTLNLQRELTTLAERAAEGGSRALAMEFAVSLAHVSRELGDEEMAVQYFRQAVKAVEQEKPVSGPEALLYGVALCETGHREQAIRALTGGLSTTERSPDLAEQRAVALRHLATLSLQRGRYMTALRYLYRAEGEATGLIPPTSSFWPCLADQLAWSLYAMHEYEDALVQFRRAAKYAGEQEHLRAQPLEGAALCCLALGRSEEAVRTVRECATLREQLLPHDKIRLGLVYLLLGQAYDQAGELTPAVDAYARAASLLPVDMAEHAAALENRALALTQMEAWERASAAWSALISALPEEAETRRDAARKQLDSCRQKLSGAPAAAPEPPSSSPASRITRRRARL